MLTSIQNMSMKVVIIKSIRDLDSNFVLDILVK